MSWPELIGYVFLTAAAVLLLPLRLFSKPEMTLLEISPKDRPESD